MENYNRKNISAMIKYLVKEKALNILEVKDDNEIRFFNCVTFTPPFSKYEESSSSIEIEGTEITDILIGNTIASNLNSDRIVQDILDVSKGNPDNFQFSNNYKWFYYS